jgi:hypothetical protein
MENRRFAEMVSLSVPRGHVTRCRECTPAKPSRERATCTSWRPLPRHHAESSGPAGSVSRADVPDLRSHGADSYPSQYPTPAGLLASAGRSD